MGDSVATNHVGGETATLSVPASTTGHETISSSIEITALNGGFNSVGIVDNAASVSNDSIACSLFTYMGTRGLSATDTNDLNTSVVSNFEMMIATYIFEERRDTTSYVCTARRGGTNDPVPATFALVNDPYTAGVLVVGAAVQVQWFMVVSNP